MSVLDHVKLVDATCGGHLCGTNGDNVASYTQTQIASGEATFLSAPSDTNSSDKAALLRLDDKSVDQVMARILSGEEEDPSLLWDALASAGSPKAQEALRQLIDDPRFDVREHRMQMIGLSFAPQPTAETVHYLASKFSDEDQAQQARFGVGTALNHLRGKDDGLLNEGLQTLTAQLSASKTMGETSDLAFHRFVRQQRYGPPDHHLPVAALVAFAQA